MAKPDKVQLASDLRQIVLRHKDEPWSKALQKTLEDDVHQFFASLGIGARKLAVTCDSQGFVDIIASDYFRLKDLN